MPVFWTLADVSVVEGGLVSPNERLAEIVDPDALEVAVPGVDLAIRTASGRERPAYRGRGDVSLDIFGVDLATTGTITRESAAVGEGQTGRVLFAQLDQATGFRPGDFVTVRIEETRWRTWRCCRRPRSARTNGSCRWRGRPA